MDAWAREKGEPNLWYGRFEVFRLLGPGRSLDGAYRAEERGRGGEGEQGREAKGSKGKHKKRPSRHWYAAAKRWRWVERAEAWDAAERDKLRAAEADRRFDARQRRLDQVDELQAGAFKALAEMDLGKLEKTFDLAKLAQLRITFVEMMKAERLEFGEVTQVNGSAENPGVQDKIDRGIKTVYG